MYYAEANERQLTNSDLAKLGACKRTLPYPLTLRGNGKAYRLERGEVVRISVNRGGWRITPLTDRLTWPESFDLKIRKDHTIGPTL